MDPQIIHFFKRWQEKEGKYPDLDIEKVEFEARELGKISSITPGQSPSGKDINSEGIGTPFYQGKTEFTDKYVGKPRRWTTNSKRIAEKNDILYSMRAPAGAVNVAAQTMSIGRGLSAITPYSDYSVDYLFYFFKVQEKQADYNNDKGGFYSSITKDELFNTTVLIPKSGINYSSYQIQQAIVEFLDYRLGLTQATRKQVDSIREKVELMDKIMLPKIFEMKDPWLRGQFNKWAELKGYDIGVDDLQFHEIALLNQEYFQFIKGKNAYIKKYNLSHPGKIPLATGSVKNNGIGYYVEPIDESHIIKEESVSFNKDGDTKAFYRDYPYLMDRHHIAIIPTKGKIAAKYLFFVMDLLFKNADYNWGEHTANAEEVAKNNIKVPKPTKRYSSYQVQQMLVEFYSAFERFRDKLFGHIDRVHQKVDKLDEATIARTFKRNK